MRREFYRNACTSGEFTENLLEIALANARLSPADRGLCHELVCGVVRWQATLDCLIARKTTPGREQRPALKNLLRLGLYQIFWLDRIPPHAAVHETVEQAKRAGYGQQAGFINAVLRGYLREADEIKKILADMKISQPALGWSHPEWLVEKWRKNFGDEKTRQLLEWNNTPPKTFARVNTLKTDAGKLVERWREEKVEYDFFTRDWTGENLVFELKSHPPLNSLRSFRDGWFYVQDPSTLLRRARTRRAARRNHFRYVRRARRQNHVHRATDEQRPAKSSRSDIAPDRLKLIRENCTRLGVTCVETTLPASTATCQPATFDRILIDAPCSNTGVMRRRVDLRWRISPEEIARLQKTQLDLLQQAATKMKPGGILVYSTCSLEPEENSELVKQFLAAHQNFELETERQLLPFADGVDGAYAARLKSAG